MSRVYEYEPYRDGEGPPTISEILLPRGPEHHKIDYRRAFAWKPILTADEDWIWLQRVWRISIDGTKAFYTRSILPLGWHR